MPILRLGSAVDQLDQKLWRQGSEITCFKKPSGWFFWPHQNLTTPCLRCSENMESFCTKESAMTMTQNQCITRANKSRERPDSHKYLEVWQFQHHYQCQLVLGKINEVVSCCHETVAQQTSAAAPGILRRQTSSSSRICRAPLISAGLSFVSEGWLDLVWDVWGDLALLYMSLILLLRFPDNAGMPFVLAMAEVRNKQKHAGFLKSRLSTGTLVSFISFCWPKQVTRPRPDSRDDKTDLSFK